MKALGYVPVVVDENSYGKYIVCVDEFHWSIRDTQYHKTTHFSKLLREESLPDFIFDSSL